VPVFIINDGPKMMIFMSQYKWYFYPCLLFVIHSWLELKENCVNIILANGKQCCIEVGLFEFVLKLR